jgi:NAD(P)-dependent dehydrogenase (short-subunit alcohol dehydrogenase family)
MTQPYSGRLAIIAGGIGGLGSIIAQRLQANGARLILLYAPFEADRVKPTLERVFTSPDPERVHALQCDITAEVNVNEIFSKVIDAICSDERNPSFPSILVNAAGYVSVQPLEDTTANEAMKNFLPNLLGPFITSNAFFKLYRKHALTLSSSEKPPPGRIISIASQAAHVALEGHGAYCASKAGLLGLTRCQASEWGSHGITSNTISPTVTWTPLAAKAWADEGRKNKHLSEIPTGRFAVPEEIAAAVEFLCRDESGMINGSDLRVDGGFTIR